MKAERVVPKDAHETMSVEQAYMEMKVIEQQVQQVQQYLELLEQQVIELHTLMDAIHSFKDLPAGSHTLAPLANGIFFPCETKACNTFYVNVGSGIVVEKTADQAITLLNTQQEVLEKNRTQAALELNRLIERAQSIEKQMRSR
jgi:prefoldin alpha subunit